MEYRLKRQVTISSVFFLIVFGVLGFWIFSQRDVQSCFDGKLNQGEERIDCGGSCAPCSELYLEDLEVITSGVMPFNGTYDAYAQVQNKNSQHGTGALFYAFKFYDQNGNFISEKRGKSHILAGQTRYIIESNLSIDNVPKSVKFEVEAVPWSKQERSNIKLPIFSKKFESTVSAGYASSAQVTGVLENQTDYSFVKVELIAVLLGMDNNFISISKTEVDNLRAGERRDFVVPWFSEVKEKTVANVYIEATTNVFDDSNILR